MSDRIRPIVENGRRSHISALIAVQSCKRKAFSVGIAETKYKLLRR